MKPHRFTKPYMWMVTAAGALAVPCSLWHLSISQLGFKFLFISLITLALTSRINLRLPRLSSGVSLSDAFIFLTLLLCGGEAAVALATVETLVTSWRLSKKGLTRVFNTAAMASSTFLTAWVLQRVFGPVVELTRQPFSAELILAVCLMALLQYVLNSGLIAIAGALRANAPIWETWKRYYLWTSIAYFASASAAALTARLIDQTGLYALLAMAPIIAVVYFTYATYLKNIEASAAQAEQAERHTAELRESEERFRSAFDHAPIGMALVAPDGRWLQVNRSLSQILGYSEKELLATDFQSLTHPEHLGLVQARIAELLEGRSSTCQLEKRYFHKLGHQVWAHVGISLTRSSQDGQPRLIFQIQDITDRKNAEEQLLYEASHDALTQLPNRTRFMDLLRRAIKRAQASPDYLFAVLFIDLDRFKIINDSLGHMIGDKLLVEITRRLQRCLRAGDSVARLGGDEFTILLEGMKDLSDVIAVAERIQKEVSQPCLLDGHETFTTASIGIALYDATYKDPAALLRDADTAMYQAKSAGKARHVIFDSTMHCRALHRMKLEADLRRAIERQEFFLLYQPIVLLTTGQLTGFEALLRWRHPERGLVSPAEFIPIAEETGTIVPIGEWVLQEAVRQTRQWQRQFPWMCHLKLSVNLSGKQFTAANLIERIIQTLHLTGFDPHNLKLEITETVLMENIETATEMLRQLRALGVQLSIDDFGTGYSSLSYLHRLPINTLKVDRSFVGRMAEHNENLEIVRTIITLAKNLGLDVVAEGIETQDQVAQLRQLDCEYGQGYLFSKPLEAAAAEELMLEMLRQKPELWAAMEPCAEESWEPLTGSYTM